MSKRSIGVFLGALLLFTWAVQCAAILVVGNLNTPPAAPWLISTMFLPALWTLVYGLAFNRDALRRVAWRPGNPLYLILAPLIPAALSLAVMTFVLALGWGTCDFFSFSNGNAEILKGPWLLGSGPQSWALFAANIAVTAMAYGAINSIAAVGEELGWRGFLQPHMIEQFGTTGGIALLGLVWAFWHLPANLAGYNYPQTPVLGGFVLFPLDLVAMSFIMAWITIRARSFWPAVLIHGSINGIYEGVLSHLTLSEGMARLRVDVAAIVVAVALGLSCLYATVRRL